MASTYNNTPGQMIKSAALSYRIPEALKAELQKLADADRRKLGPYIQLVLEEHVASQKRTKVARKKK